MEKCEPAIKEIHRPIFASNTAQRAKISLSFGRNYEPVGAEFNENTYDYMRFTKTSDYPENLTGWISSFNMNTYKGRIFIREFGRPISFSVSENMRSKKNRILITYSLAENAKGRLNGAGELEVMAFVSKSRSDQIKRLHIVEVNEVKSHEA